MRNVGIVRRVDALGRVVIPREYRKMHRIEIGDPLEIIALDNGDIVLRKVDINSELASFGQVVAQSAAKETGKTVVIGSNRVWLTGAGAGKGKFIESEIAPLAAKYISDRKDFVGKTEDIGMNSDFSYIAICPIFGDLDCFGAVSLFSDEPIDDGETKLVKTMAAIMGNNLQKY